MFGKILSLLNIGSQLLQLYLEYLLKGKKLQSIVAMLPALLLMIVIGSMLLFSGWLAILALIFFSLLLIPVSKVIAASIIVTINIVTLLAIIMCTVKKFKQTSAEITQMGQASQIVHFNFLANLAKDVVTKFTK